MIDQFTFGQIHLFWPIIIGSVFLWLVFIWKEWNGKTGSRFYIKILVALLAIGALAMIALQPKMRTVEKIGYSAILSPGYQKAQLDSLKKVYKSIKLIDYKPGRDLSASLQKGQEVFVLGQGLQAYDLWQLDDVKVHMLSGTLPVGVTRLKYEQQDVVGNVFRVEGEYHKAEKGQQLVLMGPGDIPLDSVQLRAVENQRFNLKSQHLVVGKFEYAFVEKDSIGNQLSSAPLSFNIKDKNKLSILMVNQFPSFETKYLKNFLAESGHQVMVRSQVSKERYKYEYFNTGQKGTIGLSTKTLSEVDLLIIDAASLQKASKSMLERLQTAIATEGLGVFIQADVTSFNAKTPLLDFSFSKFDGKEVTFEAYPKTFLATYPYVFKHEHLLETIYKSGPGMITAYKRSGAGRIGTTVLQNTYELLLKGKAEVYQIIWSATISSISKRKALETVWEQDELMVHQDAPFNFNINTTRESPLVKSIEGFSIPLARNIELKQRWSGTVFPRKLGWNKLIMKHDSTEVLDFYVIDSTQWTSIGVSKRISDNRRYFDQTGNSSKMAASLRPVQPWWFFVIFLAAMAYLWLEPKL